MANPCPGHTVTTPYGQPGSWAAQYHTGADYACPTGTGIVAAAAGHVVRNVYDESYGWMVEVETEQIRHRYCHLRAQSWLAPGAWIGEGQMIGEAGSTGNSTGPHLHYEERVSPFGYWDHREPRFNTEPPEEDDMPSPEEVAAAVWAHPMTAADGSQYAASAFLEASNDQAEDVINYPIPPDGGHLWAVLRSTLDAVQRIEAKLDGGS